MEGDSDPLQPQEKIRDVDVLVSTDKHTRLVESMKNAEKEAENEESFFLVELVAAATTEIEPEYTLNEIYQAVLQSQAWTLLDPLNLFALLAYSDMDGAQDLINLTSLEGNAKEAVIALQESLEHLQSNVRSDTENDQKHAVELVRLLGICEKVAPRVRVRRKGPVETLQPILTHLRAAINLISPLSDRNNGRRIISSVSVLVRVISEWVARTVVSEFQMTNNTLLDLLQDTLSACAEHTQVSLAQRRFEAFSPRLVLRSSIGPDSALGVEAVGRALESARLLGFKPESPTASFSVGQLILLAHGSPELLPKSPDFLQKILPVVISSIQQNIAMDESLALLLAFAFLHNYVIPEEILNPIASLLTPLASTHEHPPTRHVTFRTLALYLSRAPPPLHLAHLSSLLTDCPFPQMRVAAVGLVKEAFLNTIDSNAKSPFTSPTLVRALGPVLFRPDPEDLFYAPTVETLKTFLESSEPARLTECMAFYYVLLKRDTKNSTGIRDRDVLRTVENGLLAPLRRALPVWLHDSSSIQDPHTLIPLASLELSLERVDGAIASLV